MTIRSAIRLERAKLRKSEKAAEERLAAVRTKISALDAAEAALDGETPPVNGSEPPKRTRTYKGRRSFDQSKADALHAIRAEGDSGAVSAADLAAGIVLGDGREIRIPHSTAAKAIEALKADGRVKVVGTTSRGGPVVRYVPMRIRPGEEVRA
jgi:hypothetical protein